MTCGVTHVLLPVVLLARRADTAVVIGTALAAKATGAGYRVIAALLGRPAETVRGWLRLFTGRVEAVRAVFTVWLRALAPDPVMPAPAGGGSADAVAAIEAAARAAAGRFVLSEVSVWETTARCSAMSVRAIAERHATAWTLPRFVLAGPWSGSSNAHRPARLGPQRSRARPPRWRSWRRLGPMNGDNTDVVLGRGNAAARNRAAQRMTVGHFARILCIHNG
jgi:hypothetical protein